MNRSALWVRWGKASCQWNRSELSQPATMPAAATTKGEEEGDKEGAGKEFSFLSDVFQIGMGRYVYVFKRRRSWGIIEYLEWISLQLGIGELIACGYPVKYSPARDPLR